MAASQRYPWLPAIAVLGLAACASEPQPDPMQVKLDDVDNRLMQVERVVNNQSLLQLSQRIDELEAQVRELRGQVEELQNGDDALRKQQRDLYADLDRRLKALELATRSGAAPVAGGAPPATGGGDDTSGAANGASAGAVAPQGGGEQASYTRAFDALKANDYNTAISQFHDFLRQYPQSTLGGNAQYWLGEAYYVTHDYDNAIAAFRAVGTQYPQSPKVPDALLKVGLTQIDQNKLVDARATLRQVVLRYSGSSAAKLASARLQSLPPEAP